MSDTDLIAAATILRVTLDDAVAAFGGTPQVLQDAAQACDPSVADGARLWVYQLAVPATPDATGTLRDLAATLTGAGWTAERRDTERESAVSFQREGYTLGIMVGSVPGADVVLGGSTPCIEA